MQYVAEEFDDEEQAVLRPYFTNLDGPVFALVNLPEVVKGALFARYSRSAKSLRRLFLDEFADQVAESPVEASEMVEQARRAAVPLLVNHTRRLFPANGQIKELLDRKVLGDLQ